VLSIDLKRVRAEVTDVWSGEPTDDATLVQKVAEYGRSPGFPPDPPERMSTLGGLREQLVGSEDSSKKGERIAEQHAPIAPPSRVIVADDHPLFRYALRSVLECSESFEVITEAADGQQALELARTHNPDLVLMDVRMPKMDGLEATRAIKRVLPQTVVLMLTAHEETSHLAEAIKAGAAGYVLKGESPQQITAAIHAALDGESPSIRRSPGG
jgi:CheY-like chemotaxis protein